MQLHPFQVLLFLDLLITVWAIVDCVFNRTISKTAKIGWLIALLLAEGIAALFYLLSRLFFNRKRRERVS